MLLLLQQHLLLVELLDCGGVDVLVEVGRVVLGVLGCLFDPKVLRRLEVVAKDGDDFLDLVVTVRIYEKVEGLVEDSALRSARILTLHGLNEVLVLLQGLLQNLLV